MERSPEDFNRPDRSPWARHKYVNRLHLFSLRVHGYSACVVWPLFVLVGLSVKGSAFHVMVGSLIGYLNIPISILTGLHLFTMLFKRASEYENIMKAEGPATILIFGFEFILTWTEAFVVPSILARMNLHSSRALLSAVMLGIHSLTAMLYMKICFVLVVPMIITNVVDIPVHIAVFTGASASTWMWHLHHKLNAMLLPYIAMPGTTLVIGRDAYWIFSPERIGSLGLHNLRDRVLVQNLPIVIYLACIMGNVASTLAQLS